LPSCGPFAPVNMMIWTALPSEFSMTVIMNR